MQGGDDMKRIVVCDDNTESLKQLKLLLNEYFSDKKDIAEVLYYSSGEKMLDEDALRRKNNNEEITPVKNQEQIDIAILDVEMKGLNGIQTGYEILKRYPEAVIMITTAFMRYLDDAMDLKVFRYLEKPVDKERLFRALDISLKEKEVIDVPTELGVIRFCKSEIVCIYSNLRKSTILTDRGSRIKTEMNIKEWLKKIGENNSFASPHYSYIVNLKYVTECTSKLIGLKCKNGEIIKIYPSKRKFSDFKTKFYEKMREII